MKSQDATKFAEAFVAMGELYDKQVSNVLAKMYFDDLAQHSIEVVLSAMAAHRRDPDRGRFFPKPADLIHQINASKPSAKESALIAWAEVPRLLRNSRAAKSADPITERVVGELGGWIHLGQKTEKELVWIGKEFAERYELYADKGDVVALGIHRELLGRD